MKIEENSVLNSSYIIEVVASVIDNKTLRYTIRQLFGSQVFNIVTEFEVPDAILKSQTRHDINLLIRDTNADIANKMIRTPIFTLSKFKNDVNQQIRMFADELDKKSQKSM
jgi:hypothetical protein